MLEPESPFHTQRFDKLLTELGAVRVGEVFQHDASSNEIAEEAGVQWARAWAEGLVEDLAATG